MLILNCTSSKDVTLLSLVHSPGPSVVLCVYYHIALVLS